MSYRVVTELICDECFSTSNKVSVDGDGIMRLRTWGLAFSKGWRRQHDKHLCPDCVAWKIKAGTAVKREKK